MHAVYAAIALFVVVAIVSLTVGLTVWWWPGCCRCCGGGGSRKRQRSARGEEAVLHVRTNRRGLPGPTGPPGPNFRVENTVFVDSKYGNDATGVREHPELPFQTLSGALNTGVGRGAAVGDTIWVRPATYTLATNQLTLVSGVNWYFSEGVVLTVAAGTTSGYIFQDGGAAIDVEMTGYADVTVAVGTTPTANLGFLSLTNAGSSVLFEGNNVIVVAASSGSFNTAAFNVVAGTLQISLQTFSVQGSLTFGVVNTAGIVTTSVLQSIAVSSSAIFSQQLAAGNSQTTMQTQIMTLTNNCSGFVIQRPTVLGGNLLVVDLQDLQLTSAGSFFVDVQNLSGISNPRVAVQVNVAQITASTASTLLNVPSAAEVSYRGNSLVVASAVSVDQFFIVGTGAAVFVDIDVITFDTGTLLVLRNGGAGAPALAALRAQSISNTSASAPNIAFVQGTGANQPTCLLNIDQLQCVCSGLATLQFTDCIASVAIRQLVVLPGNTAAAAILINGNDSSTSSVLDLQLGAVTVNGSANALSIGVGSNTIRGYIDSILTASGAAVFEDVSSTGTTDLRFGRIRGSNVLLTGVVQKSGVGSMTLRGNTLDVGSSAYGVVVDSTPTVLTGNTLTLSVLDLINDNGNVVTVNGVLVNFSSIAVGTVTIDFQRCALSLVPSASAAGFLLQSGSLTVHGVDLRFLGFGLVPVFLVIPPGGGTRTPGSLLARLGSVRCPAQALQVVDPTGSRIDYHCENTTTTTTIPVGSPPVNTPLFDIQATMLPVTFSRVLVAGGYNNAGNGPVVQLTGTNVNLPVTRVYSSILVGGGSIVGPAFAVVVVSPSSANVNPVGVTITPFGSVLVGASVQ